MKNHLYSLSTRASITYLALVLFSGGTGYLLQGRKTEGSAVLSTRDLWRDEYLAAPDSFSRVENTKHALGALCTQVRWVLHDTTIRYERLVKDGGSSNPQAAVLLERAIRDAETAAREFEGTQEQLYVLQDLLGLLERAGRFDAWTEIYLKALYEHPTHPVVSRLAREAANLCERAGQREQVRIALRHAATLPVEFAGKGQFAAALDLVQPVFAQAGGYGESRGTLPSGSAN